MKIQNSGNHKIKQQGFTLLELLIAMTLMLAVVLAVQLYISGVVVDQENISSRHDQNTQTRIILSNLKRDVARAGSNAKLASQNGTVLNNNNAVLGIVPIINNGIIDSISVTRIDANVKATVDCNNANPQYTINGNGINPWVTVNNIYSIADIDGVAFRCDGNGGNNGDRAQVDNVISMRFTLSGLDANGNFTLNPAANQVSMVSLCIVQSETTIRSFAAQPITQDCNGANIPPVAGRRFIRTHIDMPVYSSTFIAGTPP